MADVPAADDDDNGYQPARQRPSRGLSRKNHQSTNNIKAEDVISVALKLVVMSTEAAKALNPQLGDTDAMDTEARDDAHKFFSVPGGAAQAMIAAKRKLKIARRLIGTPPAQREIRGKTCNRVSLPRRGHIRGCACGRV
jgi:hypothetical protein